MYKYIILLSIMLNSCSDDVSKEEDTIDYWGCEAYGSCCENTFNPAPDRKDWIDLDYSLRSQDIIDFEEMPVTVKIEEMNDDLESPKLIYTRQVKYDTASQADSFFLHSTGFGGCSGGYAGYNPDVVTGSVLKTRLGSQNDERVTILKIAFKPSDIQSKYLVSVWVDVNSNSTLDAEDYVSVAKEEVYAYSEAVKKNHELGFYNGDVEMQPVRSLTYGLLFDIAEDVVGLIDAEDLVILSIESPEGSLNDMGFQWQDLTENPIKHIGVVNVSAEVPLQVKLWIDRDEDGEESVGDFVYLEKIENKPDHIKLMELNPEGFVE